MWQNQQQGGWHDDGSWQEEQGGWGADSSWQGEGDWGVPTNLTAQRGSSYKGAGKRSAGKGAGKSPRDHVKSPKPVYPGANAVAGYCPDASAGPSRASMRNRNGTSSHINGAGMGKQLTCTACSYPIGENIAFIIDKEGRNYHADCFRCIKCDCVIPDSQYKPAPNGKGPICLSCGLPQCAQCANLIVGDLIVAKHIDGTDFSFHTQCLKCVQCGVAITDKYKATEQGFKCHVCDNPVCHCCGGVIPGGSQYYLSQETQEPTCGGCYTRQKQQTTVLVPPQPLIVAAPAAPMPAPVPRTRTERQVITTLVPRSGQPGAATQIAGPVTTTVAPTPGAASMRAPRY